MVSYVILTDYLIVLEDFTVDSIVMAYYVILTDYLTVVDSCLQLICSSWHATNGLSDRCGWLFVVDAVVTVHY